MREDSQRREASIDSEGAVPMVFVSIGECLSTLSERSADRDLIDGAKWERWS